MKMKVSHTMATPDSYRQSQFYSGEHLAYYYNPTAIENRPQVRKKVENGIFTRYLEKENGLRDLISTSSTKQAYYIGKRQQHADTEELLQRLQYKNGIHYSAKLKEIRFEQIRVKYEDK